MDPIKIGEQEYTIEQLQDIVTKHPELEKSYKKLEGEFTKTKQSHKDLETQLETLKPWGEFDAFVRQNPTLAKQINDVYESYTRGGQVTQANLNSIAQGIQTADKKGDDETVKRLEALEAAMLEKQMDEAFDGLAKRAEKDGLDGFTIDGFKEFAETWLEEELGIGEDDDVSPKEIRQAYTAYKAHLLEETIKSGKIPRLNSDGGGVPDPKPPKDAPKGLNARIAQAAEYLGRLK